MSRHSSFPAIALAICLLTPAITLAQRNNWAAPLPIDVVYLLTSNTIQTYDVDPDYGGATLSGTLTLPAPSDSYIVLVPGANDRYLYVECSCGANNDTVFLVYATDSDGAPQAPPIQKVSNDLWNFVVDPNGTLAYAIQPLEDSFTPRPGVGIRTFAIDPNTGILTLLAGITPDYPPLDGLCNAENTFADPGFFVDGFNMKGTQLIDDWYCGGYDDSADYYYTRTINQQTGTLGPDVPTVGAGSSMDESSSVMFTPTSILSFVNQGYEDSPNVLYVYWPNAMLNFSCTSALFDACTYSGGITTDRTGEFIFFYTDTGAIEVARLDMQAKSLEAVGIPLSDPIIAFSLDDRLIYSSPTLQWNGDYVVPISLFDSSNGLVTDNGGGITVPSQYVDLIPALRH